MLLRTHVLLPNGNTYAVDLRLRPLRHATPFKSHHRGTKSAGPLAQSVSDPRDLVDVIFDFDLPVHLMSKYKVQMMGERTKGSRPKASNVAYGIMRTLHKSDDQDKGA